MTRTNLGFSDLKVSAKCSRVFMSLPSSGVLRSGGELSEVMVEVLVHHDAPLVAAQPAEKRVRLASGVLAAELVEATDESGEALPLRLEVPVVPDDELRVRRR